MIRFLAGFATVVALGATAAAQPANQNEISIATFNPSDAVAPISTVEGNGVKIGEGTVLHPVFGLESGVVSNVFYEAVDPTGAAYIRLLAQIGMGSLDGDRLIPNDGEAPLERGSFVYRASLRAAYDIMLSDNDAAADTGGLGLGASFHGLANPEGRLSFGIDEDFQRLIRAANYETDANTNRDINNLSLRLVYHPSERAFGGYLYYDNTIDVFERSEQNFADRMFNRFGIHPTWQWLPETQIYADVSESIVTPIGNADAGVPKKVASYPFAARVGLSTLLRTSITFNAYGGYTNGFYSSGPNFSGPLVGASLGYRYSPLGRVLFSYNWQYQDSVNANFYRDHVLQLQIRQLVAPFVMMVQPELHLRHYDGVQVVMGPPTRDDLIFAVIAGVQYNFRNWFGATLNYKYSAVETDYRYMPIGGGTLDDPSYSRHELLFGLRAAL